jgi:hypothetical protein
MGQATGGNEARKYLAAFADGELDVEQSLGVLEHMAMNPVATRRVMHQQQLRQAVGRTLRAATPAPPAYLRAALEVKLGAPAANAAADADRGPYRLRWLGRWLPLAAAAVLLLASALTLYHARPAASGGEGAAQTVLAPDLVDKFAARHNGCARALQQLNDAAAFPADLKAMPARLAAYLGTQPYGVLDLSALGYDFWKAGKCILPGPAAVHLIYRRHDGGARDSLSVWIAADKGQVPIDADKPSLIAGADKPHPMIVWRHEGLVYYIVGDSFDGVDGAAALLRSRG